MFGLWYKSQHCGNNNISLIYSNRCVDPTGNSTFDKEHGFPKSWWGSGACLAYVDPHHMFPAESVVNQASFHLNYPLGVVRNKPAVANDGDVNWAGSCTNYAEPATPLRCFEPADAWKGVLARAQRYVMWMYGSYSANGQLAASPLAASCEWSGGIKQHFGVVVKTGNLVHFHPSYLKVLEDWDRAYPPSQFEIDRNKLIADLYLPPNKVKRLASEGASPGIKNPFIDTLYTTRA